MTQRLYVHPDNPQRRLLRIAADLLRNGGVLVYPTDTSYALACHLGDKLAVERVRRLRQLSDKHQFTLVCGNLSEVADFAKLDNTGYRLLKRLTPGPYTFVLNATREVPRRLMHPKRKTIGLRIPASRIVATLLEELHEPIMSTTLELPGESQPLNDPDEIMRRLDKQVDVVIDAGVAGIEVTTLLDLTGETMSILRHGAGDVSGLR
ncbi:MAG: L-threonylcarbamoyladenylate synthase [Thiohalomonadales bacterium]